MSDHPPERLSDYLNGDLDPRAVEAVEAHLAACAECTLALAEMRRVAAWARSTPPPGHDPDLWPAVERSIRRDTPRRGPRAHSPPPSTQARGEAWRPRSAPAFLAAAVALLLLGGGAGLGVAAGARFAGAALGSPEVLDLRAMAGVLTVLVVLVPVAGITARIALRPFVDAFVRLRKDPSTEESLRLVERRLLLLEREVEGMQDEQGRLQQRLEGMEFQRRLQGD
ncbi:MAG TPA: zf-HC2 domain-containing protein [Longimicrobiaceae bacterium]|nr:zf-HC2 domain-containing protein [Longimicrobiaceae bacterium]